MAVALLPDTSALRDSSSSSNGSKTSAGTVASDNAAVVLAAVVPLKQNLLQLLCRMLHSGYARIGELRQLVITAG
jgi:hypothetical protein